MERTAYSARRARFVGGRTRQRADASYVLQECDMLVALRGHMRRAGGSSAEWRTHLDSLLNFD